MKNTKKAVMFPSPYGDYGSYQLRESVYGDSLITFPSPYGDYGSYQECSLTT